MPKTMQQWLSQYGEHHTNKINKRIHWICVPAIMFSVLGLFYSIPFFIEKTWYLNWGGAVFLFALSFYLRLSLTLFIGFVPIGLLMLLANHAIGSAGIAVWQVSAVVFIVAWIGQFWGHKIEGQKPSFLEDLQFLLIGPAWLLHFIYKKLGIAY